MPVTFLDDYTEEQVQEARLRLKNNPEPFIKAAEEGSVPDLEMIVNDLAAFEDRYPHELMSLFCLALTRHQARPNLFIENVEAVYLSLDGLYKLAPTYFFRFQSADGVVRRVWKQVMDWIRLVLDVVVPLLPDEGKQMKMAVSRVFYTIVNCRKFFQADLFDNYVFTIAVDLWVNETVGPSDPAFASAALIACLPDRNLREIQAIIQSRFADAATPAKMILSRLTRLAGQKPIDCHIAIMLLSPLRVLARGRDQPLHFELLWNDGIPVVIVLLRSLLRSQIVNENRQCLAVIRCVECLLQLLSTRNVTVWMEQALQHKMLDAIVDVALYLDLPYKWTQYSGDLISIGKYAIEHILPSSTVHWSVTEATRKALEALPAEMQAFMKRSAFSVEWTDLDNKAFGRASWYERCDGPSKVGDVPVGVPEQKYKDKADLPRLYIWQPHLRKDVGSEWF